MRAGDPRVGPIQDPITVDCSDALIACVRRQIVWLLGAIDEPPTVGQLHLELAWDDDFPEYEKERTSAALGDLIARGLVESRPAGPVPERDWSTHDTTPGARDLCRLSAAGERYLADLI